MSSSDYPLTGDEATAAHVIGRAVLGVRGRWDWHGDGELIIRPQTREEAAAVLAVMTDCYPHDWSAAEGGERYRDRHGRIRGGMPVRLVTIRGRGGTEPDDTPPTVAMLHDRATHPASDDDHQPPASPGAALAGGAA